MDTSAAVTHSEADRDVLITRTQCMRVDFAGPDEGLNPVSVIPDPRRLSRKQAVRSLQAGLLTGVLLGIAPMRALADEDKNPVLVGSWLIRSRPADKPLPISSLITYTAQGTCIQTTVYHPMRSPAMGAWVQLDEREFAVTFDSCAFDPSGQFTKVSQVRLQSVLNDSLDSYKGRFEVYTLGRAGAGPNGQQRTGDGHTACSSRGSKPKPECGITSSLPIIEPSLANR